MAATTRGDVLFPSADRGLGWPTWELCSVRSPAASLPGPAAGPVGCHSGHRRLRGHASKGPHRPLESRLWRSCAGRGVRLLVTNLASPAYLVFKTHMFETSHPRCRGRRRAWARPREATLSLLRLTEDWGGWPGACARRIGASPPEPPAGPHRMPQRPPAAPGATRARAPPRSLGSRLWGSSAARGARLRVSNVTKVAYLVSRTRFLELRTRAAAK